MKGICGERENEMYRFLSGTQQECPYFRLDDEYAVVRHQM